MSFTEAASGWFDRLTMTGMVFPLYRATLPEKRGFRLYSDTQNFLYAGVTLCSARNRSVSVGWE
jgi:hypothetical protein